jgi:hypothetical protein
MDSLSLLMVQYLKDTCVKKNPKHSNKEDKRKQRIAASSCWLALAGVQRSQTMQLLLLLLVVVVVVVI